MISFWVAFLCALMVGAALTLLVRNQALRHGWVDQASSSRKIHQRPVPRLGGVAIVGGFFAPLIALLLVDSSVGITFRQSHDLVWGLFGGGIAVAFLGLYDDFRGAGARKKFTVQLGVALALYWLGFRIEVVANPFGPALHLGFLALPFTCFWIVGVINAMNLIDGLDGLAGGVAFFAVFTNFFLAFTRGDTLMSLVMAALAGAILGFLIFNFNPASIFMGDTGSMFLGFVLATASIKTSQKSGTAVAMLVPIISLGLPIMDTLLAIIRRSVLGRPMFAADKEHMHHRLMSRLFLSHRHAVLFLYGVCCLFALASLGLAYANSAQSAMLLSGVGIVVIVLMRKLGYLTLRGASAATVTRRKNTQLRTLVREATLAVGAARSTEAIWSAVKPLAEALDVSLLELKLGAAEGPEAMLFQTRREGRTSIPLEVVYPLEADRHRLGTLTLTWRDGRVEIDRDEELALELVADAIAAAAQPLLPARVRLQLRQDSPLPGLSMALVSLLRAFPESLETVRDQLSRADWDSLLAEARFHGLSAWLHHVAETSGARLSEPDARLLSRDALGLSGATLRAKTLLWQTLSALEAAGVRPVLLKGYALGARLYPDPLMRPTSDVDLLVSPGELECAARVLQGMGLLAQDEISRAYHRAHHYHLTFESSAGVVELHFRLLSAFGAELDGEGPEQRALFLTLEGRTVRVLAPEDEFLYLALHAANHLFGRLSWLYDLKLFWQQQVLDPETMAARARAARLAAPAAVAFAVLRRLLGTSVQSSLSSCPQTLLAPLFTAERLEQGYFLTHRKLGFALMSAMASDGSSRVRYVTHHVARTVKRRLARRFPDVLPQTWRG